MFTWILIGGVVLFFFAGRQIYAQPLGNVSHTFGSAHLENILNFKISDFAAKVNIIKGKSNEIVIKAENIVESDLKCGISPDKTLTVSYKPKWFGILTLPNFHKTAVINIYVPEDKVFEKFKINQGIGNIGSESIKANHINIAGGVGNSTVAVDTKHIDIKGGVGNITVNGKVFGNAKIDGGVGNINANLDGNATDLKIAGGVGDIKLYLKGNIHNYNLDVKNGVGTVRINGVKYEKISGIPKNSGAKYKLSIDGGVGNIDLKTI